MDERGTGDNTATPTSWGLRHLQEADESDAFSGMQQFTT